MSSVTFHVGMIKFLCSESVKISVVSLSGAAESVKLRRFESDELLCF